MSGYSPDPGDIILFSGRSLASRVIQLITWSKWSHVGIVVAPHPGWRTNYILESTTLHKRSDGTRVMGVQTSDLFTRALDYGGSVYFRQLHPPATQDQLERLNAYKLSMIGRTYERSARQLLRSAIDRWIPENDENFTNLFCSELVAGAYNAMGLLLNWPPANEYTPKDFAKLTKLQQGFELGPILRYM